MYLGPTLLWLICFRLDALLCSRLAVDVARKIRDLMTCKSLDCDRGNLCSSMLNFHQTRQACLGQMRP